VISENWRNGAGGNVREYSFSYAVAGQTTITDPLRSTQVHSYTHLNGVNLPVADSQPAGAGCPASSRSRSYDTQGNVTSKIDFNGTKSCHAYDLSRNLETARLDGLGAADACPADIGAFSIPADASQRKTTTQWHPAWGLPIKQAEPKKITISVYNGQPDPTAGNATASCAPTTALLPDGSPIAVLCKKIEEATTDATGSLGFNAAVTGTPRTWTYRYNQYGQMLTARDPLNKLTTYAYYSDTTDQHTMGDLQSVTDSTGRVTQYTRYDKSGRLMQSIDANGTVTDTTYTPRGWVKTVTVTAPGAAAQASLYDYDGVGQLKKATLHDAMVLEYTYDAAHRLTSVKDAAGNSVTYTLDSMGNRTGEDLKDPSGSLARNITRAYDALSRVQSATEANQ
jgi:YD repeat-containing protein